MANLRLRCRAHNQHEAERVFGAGFMREKREAARVAREGARDPVSAGLAARCLAAASRAAAANPPTLRVENVRANGD